MYKLAKCHCVEINAHFGRLGFILLRALKLSMSDQCIYYSYQLILLYPASRSPCPMVKATKDFFCPGTHFHIFICFWYEAKSLLTVPNGVPLIPLFTFHKIRKPKQQQVDVVCAFGFRIVADGVTMQKVQQKLPKLFT